MATKHAAGFWVPFAGIKLDESADGATSSWIQALPLGTYEHPVYGEIQITPEKVDRMVQNFEANVRGTQLDIDYDHKQHSGEAAGWVKQVQNKGQQGLWVLVDWTKKAAGLLKDGAYRYFSPEFADEWDDHRGVTHTDVLFGGGITNRPFLKDIQPINMSEVFGQGQQSGASVDPLKEILAKLGLPEDATAEQALAALDQLKASPPPEPTTGNENEPVIDEAELAKLMESNPTVKLLVEHNKTQSKVLTDQANRLAALETSHRFSEVQLAVKTFAEVTQNVTIAPEHQLALVKVLVKLPKTLSEEVLAVISQTFEKGIVQLGEIGTRRGGGSTNTGDPTKRFTDLVALHMEKNPGMTFADAAVLVSGEHPDAFDEYADASYAGEIGSGV